MDGPRDAPSISACRLAADRAGQHAAMDAVLLGTGSFRHAGPARRHADSPSPGQPADPGMDDDGRRAARAVRDGALSHRTRRSVARDRRLHEHAVPPRRHAGGAIRLARGTALRIVDLAGIRGADPRSGHPASVRGHHRVRPPGAGVLGQHRRRPDARDRHGHRRIQAGSASDACRCGDGPGFSRRQVRRHRAYRHVSGGTRGSGSTVGGSCSRGCLE